MADLQPHNKKPPTTTLNLNDLPEEILSHIISLLPTTLDAIQTSSISHKWRNLWHSIPSLHFSFESFPPSSSLPETLLSFAHFIDKTLTLRPHSPIHSFRLVFPFAEDTEYTSHVLSWLHYAIDCGAVKLYINLSTCSYYDNLYEEDGEMVEHEPVNYISFSLPFSIFSNSRVAVLDLHRCTLVLPDSVATTLRLVSLHSISLREVSLTDQVLLDLLNVCVNLEILSLECVDGVENLKIRSSRLKELFMLDVLSENIDLVEVWAPNLESLEIFSLEARQFVFEDISALALAKVVCEFYRHWRQIVSSLANVEILAVHNCFFTFLASKDVLSDGFVLNNLFLLELQTGYSKSEMLGMAALFERCPNLDTMILDSLSDLCEEESLSEEFIDKPITFCLPSLRIVQIRRFRETESQLQFLSLLKEHGEALEHIVLLRASLKEYPRQRFQTWHGDDFYIDTI